VKHLKCWHNLRILAFALIFTTIVTLPVGWVLTRSENARFKENQRSTTLDRLSVARGHLESAINARLLLIHSLSVFVSNHPTLTDTEFDAFAKTILNAYPGIRAVQLARDNVVSNIYPLSGNERVLGLRLLEDLPQEQAEAVRRIIESRQTVVAGPVRLLQGGMGIISRTPIFVSSEARVSEGIDYWGLGTIIVDATALFQEAGLFDPKGLRLAIQGKDGLGERGEVFFGDPSIFREDPVKLDITLPNGSWHLVAVPIDGWTNSPQLQAVWGLVMLVWFGVGTALWAFLLWPSKLRESVAKATDELQTANEDLERMVAERTTELMNANRLLRLEIDERKRTDAALRYSEELARKLSLAIEQSPVTVVITDLYGTIEYVNPKFIQTTGYTREEALGQNPRVLQSGHLPIESYRTLWETITSGREW
jgi:sensor domain CHASE-containing protein